jgi:excisionase family DNA binding protein
MKVFTTGQVATICRVAPRTVSKWFDRGELKGYRIPGSQDRRIPREFLIKFMKDHGMPLGDLADDAVLKLLVVGDDRLYESIRRVVELDGSIKLSRAHDVFEAGMYLQSTCPDAVVIDLAIGQALAQHLCARLRSEKRYQETVIVGLHDTHKGTDIDKYLRDRFQKPFDSTLLITRVRTMVAEARAL